MQELTFEQVDVVSGGFQGLSGPEDFIHAIDNFRQVHAFEGGHNGGFSWTQAAIEMFKLIRNPWRALKPTVLANGELPAEWLIVDQMIEEFHIPGDGGEGLPLP